MASSKLVWTSDPEEAKRLRESGRTDVTRDAEPGKQVVRVALDRKRRAGKTVTIVTGLQHTADALTRIAAALKKSCGAGGTAKDGEIEIQGDHAARVTAELEKMGYLVKR